MDASVRPRLISGDTNAWGIIVAEKASKLILGGSAPDAQAA